MADTPLMSQYKMIKADHQDCLLFFRLGDFYEMFFEDAKIASKELGLTLTSRNKEKGENVPLAGVPYHSSSSYIAKLIAKGYSVAICEQMEDPKSSKGLVKREVVRIITPGTVIDTDYLDEKSNNYLMGIKINKKEASICYIDITTGEFKTTEIYGDDIVFSILGEIAKISPREIVMDTPTYKNYFEIFIAQNSLKDIKFTQIIEKKKSKNYLQDYFNVVSLDSFGMQDKNLSIMICATTLQYIVNLQKEKELPIEKIEYISEDDIMELNITTQRNLDIITEDKISLIGVLDDCKSAMGSRLLKKFIKNPSKNINIINQRYDDVSFFIENVLLRDEIRNELNNIYDVERIIGKMVFETVNARDLIALRESIRHALKIVRLLNGNKIFDIDYKALIEVYQIIDKTIVDEPPFSIRQGGFIKRGYNEELDDLHNISQNGKDYILDMELRERQNTGIKNLKIKYNKVFGYFIEVTKGNISQVPDNYIRKQTLANAERYILSELKEYEEKVISAKEKIQNLEYLIFQNTVKEIRKYKKELKDMAKKAAYIDVISNFAHLAVKNSYIRPEINDGDDIEIIAGRHPIVEKIIPAGSFVKNNIVFDDKQQIIILTGPNMSGKSTYMKQVALIIIMAQSGSYVPANYAKIGVVDKIFTRVGANDDLASGQSTFMLEMSEVSNIVNNATPKSFIVLDEIGRGTSTFDGISLATAITEYIHENIKAKTIFATHYHELTGLSDELDLAQNYRIEVKDDGTNIVFSREIVKGGADKSYGIEVARLAGLPKGILTRSREILKKLENRKEIIEKKVDGEQLLLFGKSEENDDKVETKSFPSGLTKEQKIVMRILENTEVEKLTPIEAIMKLSELKKILNRS